MHQGRAGDGIARLRGDVREAAGSFGLLLVGAAFMGVNYVVLKWALLGAGVYTTAFFRALLGGAVMLGVCAVTRTSLRVEWRRDELAAVGVPAALMVASQLTFAFGVKNTAAGLASILSTMMPVVSTLLAWLVLRERPHRMALVGAAVALGGVVVAATVAREGRTTHALGVVMMLLAVSTWASSNVSMKRRRPASGEIAFATWMLLLGSVVFLPLGAATEGLHVHWSWKYVAEALMAGGGGQLGFLAVLVVLRRGSVARAGTVSFMVPVFGVASGAILLDEAVHWQELAGGALIFAGVGLVVFGRQLVGRLSARGAAGAAPGAGP